MLPAVGCGGASKNNTLMAEEGTELRTFEVFGMGCPGCHGGLEKLVNKLPGVIASQANWEKQTLVIKIDKGSQVKDEDIIATIENANFTAGKRLN
jgi:copper chaperone CopZ